MSELDVETQNKIQACYNHQIKVKRIKKEIHQLSKLQILNTHISKVNFTPLGIRILIQYAKKNKAVKFQIRVDLDYPFNRPQIHYLQKNPLVSEARDLIELQFRQNQVWGPSMMLNTFIERIGELYQKIEKNGQDQVLGRYYEFDTYEKQELIEKGLKLFTVKQNTWKFLVKRQHIKTIAISYNAFLKFENVDNNVKLQFWIFVKQIKQVISNLELKTLNIKYNNNKGVLETLYFTDVTNLEEILEFLNPAQMIQRRVKMSQENNQIGSQNIIKDYSYLIEHYSLINPQESHKYLEKMQNVIKKQYNNALEEKK